MTTALLLTAALAVQQPDLHDAESVTRLLASLRTAIPRCASSPDVRSRTSAVERGGGCRCRCPGADARGRRQRQNADPGRRGRGLDPQACRRSVALKDSSRWVRQRAGRRAGEARVGAAECGGLAKGR